MTPDDNSGNISLSDTYANWHTYEIRWTPDNITWLVDGQVGRVKNRADTWNATSGEWMFPQTPCRVQISIWQGGASSNAPGTIQWAGGPIDWNSQDIQDYGYDFATFGQIEVECYNATSPPGTHSGVSYTYDNIAAINTSVIDGNDPTVLSSFVATGLNMTAGATANSSDTNSTSITNIPGGSSNGPGSNGQAVGGSGNDSSSGTGTGTASGAQCSATGFTQDCSSSTKSDGGRVAGERILGASAFAVVIALAAALLL